MTAPAVSPVEELEASTGYREAHLYCKLCEQPEDGRIGLCGDQRKMPKLVPASAVTCVLCEDLAYSHFEDHARDLR